MSLSATLLLTTLLAQGRIDGAAAGDLTAVKQLYASASYEEALARLSQAEGSSPTEQLEQYRALCLLGLGRTSEAQRSLERMVAERPLYRIADADVSPRLVSMFHDVRKRLLPASAMELYVGGKKQFDAKNYSAAAASLRQMLAILADGDIADRATDLKDLKMLAEGFLKLSEAELAAKAAAVVTPPPAPVVQAEKAQPAVYSTLNSDVVAPIEVTRKMPLWQPPAALRSAAFHGLMEFVVDEKGAVESAVMRQAAFPPYDASLLDAAKSWKFEPATRKGQPVKYRLVMEVNLKPR